MSSSTSTSCPISDPVPLVVDLAKNASIPLSVILEGIPFRFRSRVRQHFLQRKHCNLNVPLLGEIAPFLICDLLSAKQDVCLHPLIVAWWQLYLSVILFDDILDEEINTLTRKYLLPAALLQQRGIQTIASYSHLFPRHSLLDHVTRCYLSMATSADQEIHQDKRRTPLGIAKSISLARRKLSLLDLLVTLLGAATSQNKKTLAILRSSMKRLAVASQLLDDITDAPLDFSHGHQTLVTTEYLQGLQQKAPTNTHKAQWVRSANHNALKNTLALALTECTHALRIISGVGDGGRTWTFVQLLCTQIQVAIGHIDRIPHTTGPEYERGIADLDRSLKILAFGS